MYTGGVTQSALSHVAREISHLTCYTPRQYYCIMSAISYFAAVAKQTSNIQPSCLFTHLL